jgi:hypothetical protein
MSEASYTAMPSWTALAERSGDSAFERTIHGEGSVPVVRAKAAWRFASRRSPKPSAPRSQAAGRNFARSAWVSWLTRFE